MCSPPYVNNALWYLPASDVPGRSSGFDLQAWQHDRHSAATSTGGPTPAAAAAFFASCSDRRVADSSSSAHVSQDRCDGSKPRSRHHVSDGAAASGGGEQRQASRKASHMSVSGERATKRSASAMENRVSYPVSRGRRKRSDYQFRCQFYPCMSQKSKYWSMSFKNAFFKSYYPLFCMKHFVTLARPVSIASHSRL